jgi:uncharacterized OB-fold protein
MAMRDDFPLPDTDWEPAAAFWAAAARHQLAIPRCDTCSAYCWYPRAKCAACNGEAFTWTAVSGRGRLFSWTVVRHAFLPQFADEVPYATGLVALDEDPAVRLATRLVDCDVERLDFEQPVEVVFRDLSFPGIERTVTAPFFRPV